MPPEPAPFHAQVQLLCSYQTSASFSVMHMRMIHLPSAADIILHADKSYTELSPSSEHLPVCQIRQGKLPCSSCLGPSNDTVAVHVQDHTPETLTTLEQSASGLITLHAANNMLAGSTGCHAWQASFLLAEYVLSNPAIFSGSCSTGATDEPLWPARIEGKGMCVLAYHDPGLHGPPDFLQHWKLSILVFQWCHIVCHTRSCPPWCYIRPCQGLSCGCSALRQVVHCRTGCQQCFC